MPTSPFRKAVALPISSLAILAETTDNYLALAVILGFDKEKSITHLSFANVNPNKLAVELTLLGICAVSAIPDGLVVFYHMLKKNRQILEQHNTEHDETVHHHSCPTLRKALSVAINGVGLLLRTGLTIVSVKEFMNNFILPYCGEAMHPVARHMLRWGPGIPVAIGGRFIGGMYTEAAHTHDHLIGNHTHSSDKTKWVTMLTFFVYTTTFISHAMGYFFDVKEITDETPPKPQWAQYLCYGIGLLLCAITAIQDSFLEGHHVAEVKDFAKTLSCNIPDVIGTIGAVIEMLVHALPGFAGGIVFLKTFEIDEVNCWILAGAFAALDMFPSLALHGRYIVEASRDLSSCLTGRPFNAETDDEEHQIDMDEITPLSHNNNPHTNINYSA